MAILALAACAKPPPAPLVGVASTSWAALARDLCTGLRGPRKLLTGVALDEKRAELYDGDTGTLCPVLHRSDVLRVAQWAPSGRVRERWLETEHAVAELCRELRSA